MKPGYTPGEVFEMVTLEQAKVVTKHLAKEINPVSILVFGSVAKRGKGEDLDLLIVTEDAQKDLKTLFAEVHSLLVPFFKDFAIDPFVLPRSLVAEHFLTGSPFLRLVQREGRCLYMKESVKEWLKHSEEELSMARYLLQGGYCRGACYHGQQAIEKTIKGALIQQGWDLERIHSIERLLVIGKAYGVFPGIAEQDAVFIDSIYRGRYPAEEGLLPTGEPSASDAERIVGLAAQVIRQLFPENPS